VQIIDDRALLLKVRKPEKITNLIPKSKQIKPHQVIVNWGIEETRVLNNIGIRAPSPILKRYDWPGMFNPYEHQRKIADFLTKHRRAFNFSEQGTGKTASAAWAADFLMKQGLVNRVLIICPMSIMDAAWREDLFNTVMHRKVDVAYGTPAKRKKIIESDAEFVIINFDGVGIALEEIKNGGFDLIIVDEATSYKNPSTKRWKYLNAICKPHVWLWMMTGTPAAQSPEDAYGLAKLVSPDRVPRTKGGFKAKVMYKINQYKWLPKPNATEIVHDALQPAIRFTKDQCLDLPPMTYEKRETPLSAQQRKYYNMMRKKMVLISDGEEVTSANAAVNLAKLLQISSGGVLTDKKEVLEFDVTPRYNVLKEIIAETGKKVLVFVQYTHAIDSVTEKLRKDGIKTEVINGAVKASTRSDIIKRFQNADDPRVLVIQPQAAAHGVTLTAADTVVWWGPTSSLEIYEQANARVHRSGQDSKCTVFQLQGSAAERHLYRMLDDRVDVHGKIMKLYKEVLDAE